MDNIKQIFTELGYKCEIMSDSSFIINNLNYLIIVKRNSIFYFKITFTDKKRRIEKKEDITNIVERLNENLPLGYFYLDEKTSEIRLDIDIYSNNFETNLNYKEYLNEYKYMDGYIRYAICLYTNYYMEDLAYGDNIIEDLKYSKRLITAYYFMENITTLVKLINFYDISKKNLLFILNEINNKSILAKAILSDNQIIIRASCSNNKRDNEWVLLHVNRLYKNINNILSITERKIQYKKSKSSISNKL